MPSVVYNFMCYSFNFSYWFRFAEIASGDDSPESSPDLSEHEENAGVNTAADDQNIINILIVN